MSVATRKYVPVFSVWQFAVPKPAPHVVPKPRQQVRRNVSYDVAMAVQQARLSAGMTQHELGTRSNCGAATIRRIENREEAASLHTIRQIEAVVQVTILP